MIQILGRSQILPELAGLSRQNVPAIGYRMAQILGVPGLLQKMILA